MCLGIISMERDDFLIHKESFIKSRRENISEFYDFHPKVHHDIL